MASRNRNSRPKFEPQDVGTLWTLRRDEYTARCTLFSSSPDWELRVVMEDDILLAKRCENTADAFELAEHWRCGLIEHGWEQIIPMSPQRPATLDRKPSGTPVSARIPAI